MFNAIVHFLQSSGRFLCESPFAAYLSKPKVFIVLPTAASFSGEFEEIEGESEERRRARLGRHERTQERVVSISLYHCGNFVWLTLG